MTRSASFTNQFCSVIVNHLKDRRDKCGRNSTVRWRRGVVSHNSRFTLSCAGKNCRLSTKISRSSRKWSPESVSPPSAASNGANLPDRSEEPHATTAKQSRRRKNYTWSELMKRVFAADVLTCAHCGGRLRILTMIRPPETTRKILDHLGLPSRPPPLAPAAFQELPLASK